jgi:hypothetical protein
MLVTFLFILCLVWIGYLVWSDNKISDRYDELRKRNPERHDRWLATRDDRGSDMGNGM